MRLGSVLHHREYAQLVQMTAICPKRPSASSRNRPENHSFRDISGHRPASPFSFFVMASLGDGAITPVKRFRDLLNGGGDIPPGNFPGFCGLLRALGDCVIKKDAKTTGGDGNHISVVRACDSSFGSRSKTHGKPSYDPKREECGRFLPEFSGISPKPDISVFRPQY